MSSPKKFSFADLRRILGFARPYRRVLYLSIALSVLLALATPVRPWLIQFTIDKYIRAGNLQWLLNITLIQIAFLMVETGLRFYFSYLTAWLGQTVVHDMRTTVFGKVLGLNLRQFDRTPIGTLTTRTVDDIERINDVFADGLIPIIADVLAIISVLAYMFATDWRTALVCLAPFPLLILATYFFKESVNRSFHRVRNAVSDLNAFVQEHLTGMTIVQAFAAEEREAKKFDRINREHRDANVKAIFAYSVFFPVVEIVLATSTGLVVWYGSGQAVDPGTITAFVLCLNLLFRPLRIIADKFNVLQMGVIAGERVFKVLDNPDETEDRGAHAAPLQGRIEFRDVYFEYVPGQPVLKGVSFRLAQGETMAIVGRTGSGKTTIISLLNRMYSHTGGQILVDDVPIDDWQLAALRGGIGVVLQDVFLFSGSILENLTLRNPAIGRERVEEAARLIGMHDFIASLPGGYDFKLAERGLTLSMGQRQLLSFVRALLYDPAVLILDEATSSVDNESERLIETAILKLVAGRTSIVIAHRLSTIERADKILVLHEGRVVEEGSHRELMGRGGTYSNLQKGKPTHHEPATAS